MYAKNSRKIKKRRHKFNFFGIELGDTVKKDVFGVFLFAFAAISILSFVGLAGNVGDRISRVLKFLFGFGFILFPVFLFILGLKVIKSESASASKTSLFGLIIMMFSLLSMLHIFHAPEEIFSIAAAGRGGGVLGAVPAWILINFMGQWGFFVIAVSSLLVSVLIVFNIKLTDLADKVNPAKLKQMIDPEGRKKEESEEYIKGSNIKVNIVGQSGKGEGDKGEEEKGIISFISKKIAKKISKSEEYPTFSIKSVGHENNETVLLKTNDEPKQELLKGGVEEKAMDRESELENHSAQTRKVDWKMPSLDFLDRLDKSPTSGNIKANSNIIKRTLSHFGIAVEMSEVNVGPTVTQYTLKPAEGIKLSRVTSLQNDLAMALAARSLRIEAPIPGKSRVGIEIPNRSVAMVGLRNILDSDEFRDRNSNLSIILGRDVSGKPVLADLATMPHLMIAGSTGSGKTVCINTIITGLLFQTSPEMLKFIMIDPKRVELTSYNDIPHLLTPVITDPDKAINALKWSISEMENRYELLSHLGSRNIKSYNKTVKAKYKQRDILPYLIIIIDELADLMATHSREMEAAVVRLAQMARAVGIHLILSTQRPSVEVITGLIKANITTRIAFQVASQIDSRTIIDMSGAEKLLGNGDMLYLSSDSNKPIRIQGVFVSEEEVKKITAFFKNQKIEKNEYNEEITEDKDSSLDFISGDNTTDDDLYDDAVEVVMEAGKASASLLQRRLRIGYARAARLLDLMEEQEVIGPANGAKPRKILKQDASDTK